MGKAAKESEPRLINQIHKAGLVAIGALLVGAGVYSATQTPVDNTHVGQLPPSTPTIGLSRDAKAQAYCLENKFARTIAIDDTPDQAREAINTLLYCAYLVQAQGLVK